MEKGKRQALTWFHAGLPCHRLPLMTTDQVLRLELPNWVLYWRTVTMFRLFRCCPADLQYYLSIPITAEMEDSSHCIPSFPHMKHAPQIMREGLSPFPVEMRGHSLSQHMLRPAYAPNLWCEHVDRLLQTSSQHVADPAALCGQLFRTWGPC